MTEQDQGQPSPKDMTPLEKLRNLEQFMPDYEETVYHFGRFLADRLDRPAPQFGESESQELEIAPRGVMLTATLAVYDLQHGVDGYTGKPIQGKLASLSSIMYSMMEMYVPKMVRATFPPEFADEVEALYKEVNEEVNKKSKSRRKSKDQGPEINHAAVIPGKDPFEMVQNGEKVPSEGIFVHAEVRKGYMGSFDVYDFKDLESRYKGYGGGFKGGALHYRFSHESNSKWLAFGYEHPNYPGKTKEPFSRGDVYSYVPFGFEEMDIVQMPISGGRLLVIKEPFKTGNSSGEFRTDPDDKTAESLNREVLTYLEPGDFKGMQDAITAIGTELLGLNKVDAILMANNAWSRLDPEGFKKLSEEASKNL